MDGISNFMLSSAPSFPYFSYWSVCLSSVFSLSKILALRTGEMQGWQGLFQHCRKSLIVSLFGELCSAVYGCWSKEVEGLLLPLRLMQIVSRFDRDEVYISWKLDSGCSISLRDGFHCFPPGLRAMSLPFSSQSRSDIAISKFDTLHSFQPQSLHLIRQRRREERPVGFATPTEGLMQIAALAFSRFSSPCAGNVATYSEY